MSLTKAEILAADDRPVVSVNVPEWGGVVILRALMLEDLMRFQSARSKSTDAEVLAWLVAYSAVDDQGVLLFDEADVKALTRKATPVIKRLSDEALILNGMAERSDEDRLKNS